MNWNVLETIDCEFFEGQLEDVIIRLQQIKEKYKDKNIEIWDTQEHETNLRFEVIEICKDGAYYTPCK